MQIHSPSCPKRKHRNVVQNEKKSFQRGLPESSDEDEINDSYTNLIYRYDMWILRLNIVAIPRCNFSLKIDSNVTSISKILKCFSICIFNEVKDTCS